MRYETCSATPLEAVQVELRPGGAASDVWLRRNIEKGICGNGPDAEDATEFYRAEEIHFVQAARLQRKSCRLPSMICGKPTSRTS